MSQQHFIKYILKTNLKHEYFVVFQSDMIFPKI